jgi:hypothetical protein
MIMLRPAHHRRHLDVYWDHGCGWGAMRYLD